jgi:hypothetical protein
MIDRFRRALACLLIVALALCAPLQSHAATGQGGPSWWNGLSPTTRDVLVVGTIVGAIAVYAVAPWTLPLTAGLWQGALGFGAGFAVGALVAGAKNLLFGSRGSTSSAMAGGDSGGPSLLGIGSR